VKVSECFLLDDDIVEADSAVTLAGTVVEEITDPDQHWALILRYKSTYARVLDCNRKFLPAASRYHDLTNLHSDKIDEGDILELLGRATTCAILAPSGAQKKRILATLYADPRLGQLRTIPHLQTHATLVTKMYRSQVIRPEDVGPFESSLADHQKAIRGDGRTILQHAVLEHNMIAVSRLYRSIYLRELNKVLGDVPAEKLAAKMITDGSLKGKIDQVEGILYFTLDQDGEDQWNKGIMSFCTELNRVASDIHDAAFFD
jgi:COP9 signalosome complex subunit 4